MSIVTRTVSPTAVSMGSPIRLPFTLSMMDSAIATGRDPMVNPDARRGRHRNLQPWLNHENVHQWNGRLSDEDSSSLPQRTPTAPLRRALNNTAWTVNSISMLDEPLVVKDSTSMSKESEPLPCARKDEPGSVSALKLFKPTLTVAVALIRTPAALETS